MTDETVRAEAPATQETVAPSKDNAAAEPGSEKEQVDAQPGTGEPGEKQERKDDGSRRQSRLDRRIGELTYKNKQQERENAELRQRLEAVEKRTAPQTAPKPKADDYATNDDYVEALADWKVEQKLEERLKKQDEGRGKENQERQIQATRESWEAKESAFLDKTPDYDDVIQDFDIPKDATGAAVSNAILKHEKGPELVYHLARNPDLQDELFGLVPDRAVIRLKRIAAELGSKPQSQKPASNLPNPPSSVKGGGAAKSENQMGGRELLKKYGLK